MSHHQIHLVSDLVITVDVNAKRAEVRAAYPGDRWARRVDKMSDEQVLAIWHHKFADNPMKDKKETECAEFQMRLPGI